MFSSFIAKKFGPSFLPLVIVAGGVAPVVASVAPIAGIPASVTFKLVFPAASQSIPTIALGFDSLPGPSPQGVIYCSTDGVAWTRRSTPGVFTSLVYWGEFVAVGENGLIAKSSYSAVDWTTRSSGTTDTLRAVTFRPPTGYFAVGDKGVILKSTTGDTWTAIPRITSESLLAISAPGTIVAVGNAGTIVSSTDGTTWNVRQLEGQPTLTGVVFVNQFVVVGRNGDVFTSSDAKTWTKQTNLGAEINGLSYGGLQFIALSTSGRYYISRDGISWSLRQSGVNATLWDATELESKIILVGESGFIGSSPLPKIERQPISRSVALGAPASLSVTTTGDGPFTYEWIGPNVSGANNATLTFNAVSMADVGSYRVNVWNEAGATRSNPARIGVIPAGTQATHVVTSAYRNGDLVTVENTLTYVGTTSAMAWQVVLPDGWSFVSNSGAAGEVQPFPDSISVLEWAWINQPPSPVSFSYVLRAPASGGANFALAAAATLWLQPGNYIEVLVKPDPLIIRSRVHTADTNGDGKISLSELTRVIELYNFRDGNTRTGSYTPQFGTEDGFVAALRTADQVVGSYHAADANCDGRLSLVELVRVIELYNYREGTTRTGRYHAQVGTEDGYAPGP